MEPAKDLLDRINADYKRMSKGHRYIAEYILNNYDKAAFMTASKLGSHVGVSESTVVRFAIALGYDGYPKLQKALQELIRNKLTTVQRIEMTSELDQSRILNDVMKADLNNIHQTMKENNNDVFKKVLDEIFQAERIYILGLRSAAPLAQFMVHYMNFMFDNINIVTSGINDIFEQLIHISREDLMIGISFPRYAVRTIEAMAFAKKRGAKTVTLTDSYLSPLTNHADYTLLARSNMASFVDSLVAPLSLINALIVAVGLRKKSIISSNFSELEELWNEYNVYLEKDGK